VTLARVKRLLRPVRPVLGPVWRRTRFVFEPSDAWQAGPHRPTAGRPGPIRPITEAEFEAVARRHPYYRARGRYMSVAAALAGELIDTHRLESALELGPHLRPLIVGADAMDIKADPGLALPPPARVIVHDATRAPWPIGDGQYDLFVALQVFEHLGTAQNAAFREVCRVARHALISVPIDWEMDDPRNCHHRISHERALTWFLPHRPTRVEVGNPGSRKRLIYVFEDLDRGATAAPRDDAAGAATGPAHA
jgi:methyltransferase family protein